MHTRCIKQYTELVGGMLGLGFFQHHRLTFHSLRGQLIAAGCPSGSGQNRAEVTLKM